MKNTRSKSINPDDLNLSTVVLERWGKPIAFAVPVSVTLTVHDVNGKRQVNHTYYRDIITGVFYIPYKTYKVIIHHPDNELPETYQTFTNFTEIFGILNYLTDKEKKLLISENASSDQKIDIVTRLVCDYLPTKKPINSVFLRRRSRNTQTTR